MKKIIFFLIFVYTSFAISYEFLSSKPPSRAKDFYSLLFLQETKNIKQAQDVFYNLEHIKPSHIQAFKKVTKDVSLEEFQECERLDAKDLLNASVDCSVLGFSLAKASELSSSDKIILGLKYKNINIDAAKMLFFMADKNHFQMADSKMALKTFSLCGSKCRKNKLDIRLSNLFINSLDANYYLDRSIEHIALSPSIDTIGSSILKIDVKNLGSKAAFFYSMIALRQNDKPKAVVGLKQALKKSKANKDKINFWLWLLTKNKKYFKILENSQDINFYTIYFREKNHLEPLKTYKTKATDIKGSKKLSQKNINDPFYWNDFVEKTKTSDEKKLEKLLQDLGGKDAEPFRMIVYSKIENYKFDYFIHPWKNYLKDLSPEYQALILALARQESAFIPSALSRSYAIGAMQMMPFLIKQIAKEKKENIYLPDFFSARKILPYAIYHIDYLRKNFKNNPLFIAYAYNGGSGFTNRFVIKNLFKSGKFEPFLSMELVPYAESREYGKRVLTNYYMYRKILGVPVKMQDLLNISLK